MTRDEQLKLFEENEKLVFYVLNRHYPTLANDEDVQQVGLIALWNATKWYKPENDTKFASYAYAAIRRNIHIYLTNYIMRQSCDDGRTILSLDYVKDEDDDIEKLALVASPPRLVWAGPPINTLLTERQLKIYRLRKQSLSYRKIADKIGTNYTTVMQELRVIKKVIDKNILYI